MVEVVEKTYKLYAKKVLVAKGHRKPTRIAIGNMNKRICLALARPYHAVAFDIDGTLTERGVLEIEPIVIPSIWKIIQKNVTVILITGRGRGSARKSAASLRKSLLEYNSNLSGFIFRRLHCITHNGAFLLSSTTELDTDFLKHETLLGKRSDFLEALAERFRCQFEQTFDDEVEISREPCGIRIKPKRIPFTKTLTMLELGKKVFAKLPLEWTKELRVVRGIYGNSEVMEITLVDKGQALQEVGDLLGISGKAILRVGDQGEAGFNDYELLKSCSGFCVGRISKNLKGCFPVLAKDDMSFVEGPRGTVELLEKVTLIPAISLKSPDPKLYLPRLLRFEKLAYGRARIEAARWASSFGSRLKRFKGVESLYLSGNGESHERIVDKYSGSIRFKEWEWASIDEDHPLKRLFSTKKKVRVDHGFSRGLYYCMLTDTSRILRGPFYYYALAFDGKERYLQEYLDDCVEFVELAEKNLAMLDPRLLDTYRLLLGVMDNIRNILLVTGYVILELVLTRFPRDKIERRVLVDHYQTLVEHTKLHASVLLESFPEAFSLDVYKATLGKIKKTVKKARKFLRQHKRRIVTPNNFFRRWREADNFLENLLAVELALSEFSGKVGDMTSKSTIVHGIAYGGFELPAISSAIGEFLGMKVTPSMTCYHSYKNRQKAKNNSTGDDRLINILLNKSGIADSMSAIHLLADDNMTTGRTLHLVRNQFEQQNNHISGIIVVRYPGENRFVQMMMADHGCPDTDLFFTYVRGLIAPAPYTRIVEEGPPGSEYLDETGIFDKARYRICRYLYRNHLFDSEEVKSHKVLLPEENNG